MKTLQWYQEQSYFECVVCGTSIIDGSAGTCHGCHSPVELSRTIAHRDIPGKLVSVLGASGAGKTVYLGMLLDMVGKGCTDLCGLPNGAFSMAVQEQTIAALEQRRFPAKTASEPDRWKWVHCESFSQKRPRHRVDLITPDLAGEALALELEQANTYPTIRSLVSNSRGVVILFDSQRVRDAGRMEDLFGVKLLTYICSLHTRVSHERRKKVRLPICLVLTKTDCCLDAEVDAKRFALNHLPATMQFCKQRLGNYSVHAASVVGSVMCASDEFGSEIQIPLHVQPRGILEPLQWIMDQMD